MKDSGIDKGLVQKFETSDKRRGSKFGFRKMFWDYLNKLGVPFTDPCCLEASTATQVLALDGTNTVPGFGFTSDKDTGFYLVSDGTIGITLDGTQVAQLNATLLSWMAGSISAAGNLFGTDLVASGVFLIAPSDSMALNVTGSIPAANLLSGLITSTSAAPVTATLDTATNIATALGSLDSGNISGASFNFIVDNSAGANTVTVAVGAGITVITAVITGSNTLTVASAKVGKFNLYFTDGTNAILSRVL